MTVTVTGSLLDLLDSTSLSASPLQRSAPVVCGFICLFFLSFFFVNPPDEHMATQYKALTQPPVNTESVPLPL